MSRNQTSKSSIIQWIWIGVFVCWTVFLSGFIESMTGTPGIRQSLQLRSILNDKESELQSLENRSKVLVKRRELLKQNSHFQEQEVRSVLGYAADDELVFEF